MYLERTAKEKVVQENITSARKFIRWSRAAS